MGKICIILLTEIQFKIWRVAFLKGFHHKEIMGWTSGFPKKKKNPKKQQQKNKNKKKQNKTKNKQTTPPPPEI